MKIDPRRCRELLERFRSCRLLVVGDVMLDRYVAGRVRRLSPEAPVPVIEVDSERNVPGGAANVARNVRALGACVTVAGIVGNDADGNELCAQLTAHGIGTEGLLRLDGLRTTLKTRIIAERQQVVRVDHENHGAAVSGVGGKLLELVRTLAGGVDGIILEDYGKGVVTQALADGILDAAECAGKPFGYDPNRQVDLCLGRCTVATPNLTEALTAAGVSGAVDGAGDDPDLLERVGDRLAEKWHSELVMITLGPAGIYLRAAAGRRMRIPTQAREVFDVSGAGDTVIAATMLALLSGAGHEEAALLANGAAGVVVGKLGAATCSPDELLESVKREGVEAP